MTLLLQASVILWDFKKLNILLQYESHKVRVEAVVFSSCDTYLISLGGPDDSNIVLWNIEVKEALCGSYASDRTSGDAVTLSPMNLRGPCFMTGGECTLKVWTLNVLDRNLRSMNVSLGKIKRIITCIEIDYRDEFAYCGTSTGDIVKVKLNYSHDINILDPIVKPVLIGCFAKFPKKISSKQPLEAERYSQGVGAILLLDDDSIIVGAGDGTVDMVRERDVSPDSLIQKGHGKLINPSLPMLIMIRSVHVGSTVTSAQKLGDELLIGTIQCELYVINMKTFSVKLMATCHTSTIYDIAFPRKTAYNEAAKILKEEFLKAQEKYRLITNLEDKAKDAMKKETYDLKLRHETSTEHIAQASNKSKALWDIINSERKQHIKLQK
ncbi:Cilia- and flagella-associated protein 52 [Homalodisca vitripennis]|nr:Cilia- and flagella-associated protein 52 [Homalodisca vitripennis]